MSDFKILEYGEKAESLYGIENKKITELELEALLEGKRLWTDINWEYAITIRLKDRLKELELDKEIERLKDLVKQLWNNNKSSNLNEEQKELLNSTIFGSDKE